MKLSDKKGVQQLVLSLASAGITDVVLSPGSRNAPLSLSFENSGLFTVRIIPDERVAAYFALGISLQTHKPTVVCCTSGTAVLNYAPAIAEAYYQRIPLIVVTADRPAEWIDQGDGQTIRQNEVFKNYVESEITIDGDASDADKLEKEKMKLDWIFDICRSHYAPVHINVPLEEPLYHLEECKYNKKQNAEEISSSKDVQLEYNLAVMNLLNSDYGKVWRESKKILILAGQMWRDPDWENVWNDLLCDERIAVISENTSNIHHHKIIACIDRTIDGFSEEDKEKFKPDLLITLGDVVISKKVKAWLRKHKPNHHWKAGSLFPGMDTYRSLTLNLKLKSSFFIREIAKQKSSVKSDYQKNWMNLNDKKEKLHDSFLKNCEWSDLKVFSVLLNKIPTHSQLHLGNSSPVRYAQLFDIRTDLEYFSNRGVSGIDGCTSTAAGMAEASNKCVTLISGDISFFYDSNAFWNDYLKNLKVIVINNGGGGIFRIIDQPENVKDTEKLFETRHNRNAEGITKAFGLKYWSAKDENSLEIGINQLYADNLPAVLEIFTPTENNPLILKKYFSHLKNN